jgi:hypothetical protein
LSIFDRFTSSFAKRGIPTETLGTSRTTGSILTGEGAGTFDLVDSSTNFVGQRRFDEYDRMVRDVAIIGAGVRLFLAMIGNAVWSCNPPEGLPDNQTEQAQKYADQAYAALFDMTTSWSAVVRKTAAFRLVGFSIQEWTAKKNPDGSIGFKDIEHRPQRTITRWNRDESGTVESVVQRIAGRSEVTLPRSKIIYAVDDMLTDSPEGIGLFRHMASSVERLDTFLRLEEVGFSTDLRGIPIARAPLREMREEVENAGPPGSEAKARAEARRLSLLQPFRNFLDKHIRNQKTGMLMSSDTYNSIGVDKSIQPSTVPKWAIELLTGDSSSFDSMANAVNRLNQEIARILGVEHLLLGHEGGGSLALAKSKVGTFYLTMTSTLLDLLEIYDRDLIGPWAEMNGVPEELVPQMGVNEISDRDLESVVAALKDLATAGAPIVSDDPAVGEIYDLLGLTRPPVREDPIDLSLNSNKPKPGDPKPAPGAQPVNDNQMIDNPENAQVAKVRIIRSRTNSAKAMRKRRQTNA